MIGRFHTQHEAVVLVADLVSPAAEAAAGVYVLFLELGEELLQDAFALEAWSRVAVVEAAVVCADDFVIGLDHFRVEEALDAVAEHVCVVDGLQGGLGDFEHDGPVWAFLWGRIRGLFAGCKLQGRKLLRRGGLVVGRVVGEDGSAVEWTVWFGEV